MSIHVSVNDEVKRVKQIFIEIDGQKRKVVSAWINKNGDPSKIYTFDEKGLGSLLKDFKYSIENGNYVLTAWKGTYNGENSTKIIIPNDENIVL